MTLPALDSVAIGWPITRLGVSFFPVYLSGNELPAIATGEASGLVVKELEEPSVPTLRVHNTGDKPVLVVEGEHFIGGHQNRTINTTVLVPALADLDIPVSCLEQGRWGRRPDADQDEDSAGDAFQPDTEFAAFPLRAAMHFGVAESMRRRGSRRGDQAAVWQEVDALLSRASVDSPTAAAGDAKHAARRHAPERAETIEKLAARGPLPGQCGIVVAHGRRVAAMDLFGAPHLLAVHWSALIHSHLLDSSNAEGRASASRVLHALRGFASKPAQEAPGVGLGVEHRVANGRLVGHALTFNDALVHAAFSAKREGDAEKHA